MIHLYCLAVQAGFYSDVVECRTLSPADRVRSPVGEKCYFHFSTVSFGAPRWAPNVTGEKMEITFFPDRGSNPGRLRDRPTLYRVAIKAGFYSDVVECRTLSPADRVRSPIGEKCYFHFFTCYIYYVVSFWKYAIKAFFLWVHK